MDPISLPNRMEYMMSRIRIDESEHTDDRPRWEGDREELCHLRDECLVVRILDKTSEDMKKFIIISFGFFFIFLGSLYLSLSFFVGFFLFFALFTHCLRSGSASFAGFWIRCDIDIFHS